MASKKSSRATEPRKSAAKATKEVAKKTAAKKSGASPYKGIDMQGSAQGPERRRGGTEDGGYSMTVKKTKP